ncbi:MAG: hypothetical protein ACLFSZ_10860 [Puniceicoccaceae bacterium]
MLSCGSTFRFLKLETGGISPLIRGIRESTGGHVEVLTGWGGIFLLELARAGVAGVVPGMSLISRFTRIWNLIEKEAWAEADALFAEVLPFIVVS